MATCHWGVSRPRSIGSRSARKNASRSAISSPRQAGTTAGSALIDEPFFRKDLTDLCRRSKAVRPLAVFFKQKDCPDCEVLHRRILTGPELRDTLARFDALQLDLWSRTPITTPAGERLAVRDRARRLGLQYAPGIVLFDTEGREVIRWESGFRLFHTLGMFDYGASKAYRSEPDFQRFLSAKSEHIRAAGRDVDIWRYADEPRDARP